MGTATHRYHGAKYLILLLWPQPFSGLSGIWHQPNHDIHAKFTATEERGQRVRLSLSSTARRYSQVCKQLAIFCRTEWQGVQMEGYATPI